MANTSTEQDLHIKRVYFTATTTRTCSCRRSVSDSVFSFSVCRWFILVQLKILLFAILLRTTICVYPFPVAVLWANKKFSVCNFFLFSRRRIYVSFGDCFSHNSKRGKNSYDFISFIEFVFSYRWKLNIRNTI